MASDGQLNKDLPPIPSPFTSLGGYGSGYPYQTLKEQGIFRLLRVIREKADWIRKVNDADIVRKWATELGLVWDSERRSAADSSAPEAASEQASHALVDGAAFAYAIAELQWQASQFRHSLVVPSAVEGVYLLPAQATAQLLAGTRSDGSPAHPNEAAQPPFPGDLDRAPPHPPSPPPSAAASAPLQQLLAAVRRMEGVPPEEVDFHPGSGRQVVDLVHPSLFCAVFGRTKQLPAGWDAPPSRSASRPADVMAADTKEGNSAVSGASKSQKNRDPLGDGASGCGGDTLGFSWERIASQMGKGTPIPTPPSSQRRSDFRSARFQWLPAEVDVAADGSSATFRSYINNLHPALFADLYASLGVIFARCFVPLLNPVLTDCVAPRRLRVPVNPMTWYKPWEAEQGLDESRLSELYRDEEAYDLYMEQRRPQEPAVPEFSPPPPPEHRVDLRGRRLQVIVKLASIVLRAGEVYDGGVWHVEGMENERIVATGIYYFDSCNIQDSRLIFRRPLCEPDYEQGDSKGVLEVFGLADNDPLVQECGHLSTDAPGFCLAFPNLYQHRVPKFSTADPSQPGYRKILVFFLVDPRERVISTATVPPQQARWLRMELERQGHPCASLPGLALDMIVEGLTRDPNSGVMSEEEAREAREKLMEERKMKVDEETTELFEREFSLCEH